MNQSMPTTFRKSVSLVLATLIALPYWPVHSKGAATVPSGPFIGDFKLPDEFRAKLDQLPTNTGITVNLNGTMYVGIYSGKVCENEICHYIGTDFVSLGRAPKDAINGFSTSGVDKTGALSTAQNTSSGSQNVGPGKGGKAGTGGVDPLDNGGYGDGAGSNSVDAGREVGLNVGASAEAGIQAGIMNIAIQEGFRLIVLTPEHDAELKASEEHFEKSSAALVNAETELGITQGQLNQLARGIANRIRNAVDHAVTEIDYTAPNLTQDGIPSAWNSTSPTFKSRVAPVLNQLLAAEPQTDIQDQAKTIGLHALASAAKSDLAHDTEARETLIATAKFMTNLAVGLNPYTAVARDAWEFLSGKDMLTGEKLPTWQRALAGVGFTASLVSFGTASSISNGIKASIKIMEEAKGVERAEGLLAAAKTAEYVEAFKKFGAQSAKDVKDVSTFSRSNLKNEIESAEAIDEFSKHWSDAAKTSFHDVAHQLKLSPSQLAAEATRLKVSVEELNQRRLLAIGHYNSIPKFTGNAESIAEHMRGIDFSKPLAMKTIPAGTKVYQWMVPSGNVGTYISEAVETPSRLGIGKFAQDRAGNVVERVMVELTATSDIKALESTSAKVMDDWSVRHLLQETDGGAKQLLISPDRLRALQGNL